MQNRNPAINKLCSEDIKYMIAGWQISGGRIRKRGSKEEMTRSLSAQRQSFLRDSNTLKGRGRKRRGQKAGYPESTKKLKGLKIKLPIWYAAASLCNQQKALIFTIRAF